MDLQAHDNGFDRGEPRRLQIKEEPGFLTTPRILVGLAAVVLISIAVARGVLLEKPEYTEVAPRLLGLWTTSHPEYSDRFVEFRKDAVIIGTGGTSSVKYSVDGMDSETVGDVDRYTIFYRDLAGTEHEMGLFLEEGGEVLRFTDSADASWTRFAGNE